MCDDSTRASFHAADYQRAPFSREIPLDIMDLSLSITMAFPIKTCVKCGEEFELKPGKPGFANRCPDCSEPESQSEEAKAKSEVNRELNEARKSAMKNLLYRKDS
jgi:hypothetical protein